MGDCELALITLQCVPWGGPVIGLVLHEDLGWEAVSGLR